MTASPVAHTAPIDVVLERLTKVRENGRGSWTACCPAHDDRTPSLAVSIGRDERVVLYCHTGGCETAAIVRAMGLEMSDLFPDKKSGASSFQTANDGGKQETSRHIVMVKSYDYVDEHGTLLYQVCRYFDKASGAKTFRQRRRLDNGNWEPKLGDVRIVPYHLPELLEAIGAERPVFVVEGEKDVDTLTQFGYTATTNSGGAGKWRDEFSPLFKDASVVILPDNDDPGRAHAEHVATQLTAAGAMVRVVPLPGLARKGDVTDWMATHTREELEAAIAAAPRWTGPTLAPSGLPFAIRAIDARAAEPISWCVEELLVAGEIAVFAGDGGSFKSTSAFHMAAAVAGGYSAFNRFPTHQRPAFILSAEDGAGVILNRLEAMVEGHGWDRERVLSNVHIIAAHEANLSDEKWQTHLLDEARRLDVGFFVCDPLFDLVDGDENSNSELRPVVQFSRALATNTGAAVVVIHHAGKVKDGQRTIDRVRGASALVSAARCVLFFEDRPEGVAVEHLKMSRADKLPPFILTREIESSDASRAEWYSARFSFQTASEAVLSRVDSFLLDQITAAPGSHNSGDLRRAGMKEGIRGEDLSIAISHLQARGLIDFQSGARNARFWYPVKLDATLPNSVGRVENEPAHPAQSRSGRVNGVGNDPAHSAHPLRGGAQSGARGRAGQGGQADLEAVDIPEEFDL